VFGSRARGEDEEFSDLDVFIETQTFDRKIKAIKNNNLRGFA